MKNRILMCLIGFNFVIIETCWGESPLPVAIDNIKNQTTVSTISSKESKQRLADAKLLSDRGKSDAAIYMLQELAKVDPENYEVLLELGRIAVDAKNWAYSIQVFRKASLIRPKDIEVRLILMDIYKAYQMPIQEIIVAKEIFSLDPNQVVAAIRLSELYQAQAMTEEEVFFRRRVKKLSPSYYKNLKRLAEVLYQDSQLWESAKVYEQIRQHYPKNISDLRKLASIYANLDERFRETIIYDHIDNVSAGGAAGKAIAIKRIREKIGTSNPFKAQAIYTNLSESTLSLNRYDVFADYTHLFTRSLFDFGVETKYSHFNYQGKGILAGNLYVNSGSVVLKGRQYWHGGDYVLTGSVGFIHDEVSGKLFGRDRVFTASDFPFLEDPSFNSYGGTLPIGGLSFAARPWSKEISYHLDYKHSLVEELDARLSLMTQEKVSASVDYQSINLTDLGLTVDNTFVSDGNYRFHIKGLGYYTLWASDGMYDYQGNRSGFIGLPRYFVRAGYEIDYYKDNRLAQSNKYETFINSEVQHEGSITGQALLYTFVSNHQALFKAKLSYGAGTTLDYRKKALAEFSYYIPDSSNFLSLAYSYEDELSTNTTDANLQIAGFTEIHQVTLNLNWQF